MSADSVMYCSQKIPFHWPNIFLHSLKANVSQQEYNDLAKMQKIKNLEKEMIYSSQSLIIYQCDIAFCCKNNSKQEQKVTIVMVLD